MFEISDFKEDERQLELDEDIGSINQNEFSSAVVSATDWTTETLINQINKGNIKLNPESASQVCDECKYSAMRHEISAKL